MTASDSITPSSDRRIDSAKVTLDGSERARVVRTWNTDRSYCVPNAGSVTVASEGDSESVYVRGIAC